MLCDIRPGTSHFKREVIDLPDSTDSAELRTVVLLTGEAEAAALGELLRAHNPQLNIVPTKDREALDKACADIDAGARLISFCTSVIVPKDHLDAMTSGSYNFHPGPPSYPGRYPSVFALYEEAKTFGVTLHEMAPRVDEGPIVAAEWFPVPERCDLETLDTLAFQELVRLFRRWSLPLAKQSALLKPKPIKWSGTKRSKADCDTLCRIDGTTSSEEAEKLTRACGVHLRRAD